MSNLSIVSLVRYGLTLPGITFFGTRLLNLRGRSTCSLLCRDIQLVDERYIIANNITDRYGQPESWLYFTIS